MEFKWFKEEKNKKIIIYIAAIVTVLLWIPLAITDAVAYDQAYTVAMVRHSFLDIVGLCSKDVHSPLYYFISKVFYHIFFEQIFGLKICSLFFGIIYIFILAFPFRKEFGYRMSFCMIILSASLGTFLTHVSEPRMYSMAGTAYFALAFLLYKILKKFKLKYTFLFFLLSVFCVYIHTYTMLATVLLYICAIPAILKNKEDRKKRIIWFAIDSILVSSAYFPWLFSLLGQFGVKAALSPEYDLLFYIKDILYENFSSVMYPKDYQVIIWLCIFLIAGSFLVIKKSPYIKYATGIVVIYVLTAAIGIFISVNKTPVFMGRYLTCIMPLMLFVLASGMDMIKKKSIVCGLLLLSTAAGALVYRDRIRYEFDKGIDDYIRFVEQNVDDEDAILYTDIHTDSLSIFVPDKYTYLLGFEDEFNPFDNDEILTDSSQFDKIKGDIFLVCYDNKNPDWFLKCDHEKTYGFHYLYYDVSIYKITNVQ